MKFFRDALFALIAGALTLLALEAALRLSGEHYTASLFESEYDRGYAFRPNSHGWRTTDWSSTYININSDGLHDRERPIHRPPGELRIAVVGASDAECPEVSLDQTFESEILRQLGPSLRGRGKDVDVLNFGVDGYTLTQQLLTLKNHVWKYNPQIVVHLWGENLFAGVTRETQPGDPDALMAPYYELKDGRLHETSIPGGLRAVRAISPLHLRMKNEASDLLNRSDLLLLFNRARIKLRDMTDPLRETAGHWLGVKMPAFDHKIDLEAYAYQPWNPRLQEDWRIGEALMLEMNEECRRHGAEYWIVVADSVMQSHPDLSAREAYMRRLGVTTLTASDERLAEFCRDHGIRYLALAPIMGGYAASRHVSLHGNISGENAKCVQASFACHWNWLGTELAGGFIADALRSRSVVLENWTGGGEAQAPNR